MNKELYKSMLKLPRGSSKLQEAFIQGMLLGSPILKGKVNYHFTDGYGNLYVEVGKGYDVAFMSHVDTVHSQEESYVFLEEEEGFLSLTKHSENSCLGADCTTGVYLMLEMVRAGVSGLYCFFKDEEKGGLGSGWASENMSSLFKNINHAISFDRYGTSSIITHQMGQRTASSAFAEDLIFRLEDFGLYFKQDNGGTFTDSANFSHMIPNCTNISVGYYNQHTVRECQDLIFLDSLVRACTNMSWKNIPIGDVLEPCELMDDYSGYSCHILDRLEELMADNPKLSDELESLIYEYSFLSDEDNPFYYRD